jgi:signal transduction histidine kinase
VLDRLAATAAEVFSAAAAVVFLQEQAGDQLTAVSVYGTPFPVGAQFPAPPCALPDYPASLGVPLGPEAEPSGALYIYDTRQREFTARDRARLRAVADLGQVAIQAARGLRELEQVEASKSRFIQVATHELRSPVAVSQSLVRAVLKGYAGPMTDQQRGIFDRVAGRLDFLESLINDLLDLAASRAPDLAEKEGPVAVNPCVGRAVLLLQPRADEKGVVLSHRACSEELVVWATVDGLDRIFVNLVGNAVKYTPPGGDVTVSLNRSGDQVWVTVADTGIGIPADALPHLFDEFYRAPNAKEFAVGTGLGLAIVRDLVDRYHGTVEVESTEGEGTTFTVTFPACDPQAAGP